MYCCKVQEGKWLVVVNRMLAEASDTADVQKYLTMKRVSGELTGIMLRAQPCGVLSHASFPFVLSVLRQFTSLGQ